MASHTRLAILAFTVGIWLMVRETVAMETLARSATVRMSMGTGFFRAPRTELAFFEGIDSGMRMRLQNIPAGREINIQKSLRRSHIQGRRGRAANVYPFFNPIEHNQYTPPGSDLLTDEHDQPNRGEV